MGHWISIGECFTVNYVTLATHLTDPPGHRYVTLLPLLMSCTPSTHPQMSHKDKMYRTCTPNSSSQNVVVVVVVWSIDLIHKYLVYSPQLSCRECVWPCWCLVFKRMRAVTSDNNWNYRIRHWLGLGSAMLFERIFSLPRGARVRNWIAHCMYRQGVSIPVKESPPLAHAWEPCIEKS